MKTKKEQTKIQTVEDIKRLYGKNAVVNGLLKLKGAKIVGLETITHPKETIIKKSVINCLVNFDYAKNLEKIGQTMNGGASPYMHIFNGNIMTPFLTDKRTKKKLYVQVRVNEKGTKSEYFKGDVKLSEKEVVKLGIKSNYNCLGVRAYNIDHVNSITVDHGKYQVVRG